MGAFATYASVAMPTPGKKGVLKKLDNGYSEVLIGAFGAFGNGGWLYDERTAIHYMNNNPEFLQLLANKRLRSEWGHPVRQPGMSDIEWFERVNTILESNWSSHQRKLHLSSDTVKDEKGRAVIAIIAETTPCGPHAKEFERIMENPDEDLNYSIRSFAKRDFNTMRKHITKIINFDNVWTPGIKSISKFNTPSMESASVVGNMLDETEFYLDQLREGYTESANDESFEHDQGMIKIIDSLTLTTTTSVSMSSAYRW